MEAQRFTLLVSPDTYSHTEILQVLTALNLSIFPWHIYIFTGSVGLLSIECLFSHLLHQYSSQLGSTWMGLIDCWYPCVLSWLGCFTGKPTLGGIRPGWLHWKLCRVETSKEGWWWSECVLNPFISGMVQHPCPHLYLLSPCPEPSAIQSLKNKLPVLCRNWGKAGEGMGCWLAT